MFHIHQMPRFWPRHHFWGSEQLPKSGKRFLAIALAFTLVALSFLTLSYPASGQESETTDKAAYERVVAQSFSGAYLAGRMASLHNEMSLAIDYFDQALTFSPDNLEVKQELLTLLLASNQFAASVPLAAELKDVPEIERYGRLVLAADAFNKQNFAEVPRLLELEDPDLMDNLIVHLLNSWAKLGQGDEQSAIQALETLEGPVWYDLFRHYNLALMYDLIGDGLRAQAAFEQALEDKEGSASTPDSYERIVLAYGAYLHARGENQAALDLLQKASETLTGRDVFGSSIQRINQQESLPPIITDAREGAAELLYSIGTALNRPGGEAYARLYLNIALGLRPDHDATLFQLAAMDISTGQLHSATALYQRIAPSSPYWRYGQWRLGLALADMGSETKAITLLNNLLEEDPDDENLRLALASIYVQRKDFSQVVDLLDKYLKPLQAASVPPPSSSWRLFFQRGIAHERLQQWKQAEADFRTALTLSPEQPQVLNYLGYSLIDRDMKLGEALEMVRRAAQLRPKDGAIIDSLGWAYYKLGRLDDAIEALEEAVRLRPEDPTINDHLGDAYWRVGRKFEAIFQWNHALAGEPETDDDKIKIEDKLKNGLETQSVAPDADHSARNSAP